MASRDPRQRRGQSNRLPDALLEKRRELSALAPAALQPIQTYQGAFVH